MDLARMKKLPAQIMEGVSARARADAKPGV